MLLDLPIEAGVARRFRSEDEINRFHSAGIAFHQRVRTAFLDFAKRDPTRWAIIDASRGVEDVRSDVLSVVSARTPLLTDQDVFLTAPSEQ